VSSEESAELRKLRAEVRAGAAPANEILKAASAFFIAPPAAVLVRLISGHKSRGPSAAC